MTSTIRNIVALLFTVFMPAYTGAAATITGHATVINGDTISIGGRTIRLAGIDAPEINQRCAFKDGRTWACGDVATDLLAALLGKNRVACQLSRRDSFDRYFGHCWLKQGSERFNVNGAMVDAGLALAHRQYSITYIANEARAKKSRQGMWAGQFVPPWEYRQGKRLAKAMVTN